MIVLRRYVTRKNGDIFDLQIDSRKCMRCPELVLTRTFSLAEERKEGAYMWQAEKRCGKIGLVSKRNVRPPFYHLVDRRQQVSQSDKPFSSPSLQHSKPPLKTYFAPLPSPPINVRKISEPNQS